MKKDRRIRCVLCKKKKEKTSFANGRENTKMCDCCRVVNDKKKKSLKENTPHLRPSRVKKVLYNGNEFSVILKKQSKNKNIKQSQLYLIKCTKGNEVFLKLGLTTKSIKDRFKIDMPYSYEVLATMNVKVDVLLDYEQALHSLFSKQSYTPAIKFSGYTECYNLEAKSDIIKFFV